MAWGIWTGKDQVAGTISEHFLAGGGERSVVAKHRRGEWPRRRADLRVSGDTILRGGIFVAKGSSGFLERRFQLQAHGTDVRTEVLAGVTTFLTMAYIIFVNPGIVSSAVPEMPFQAVMIGTVASAILATAIMALYANYPVALAPGMGLNAYFAFTVVGAMGVPWQTALGAVFISGVIFILLTLSRCARW